MRSLQVRMIRREYEIRAGTALFIGGIVAGAVLGSRPHVEDSPEFWLLFAALTALALLIGYFMRRFYNVVGVAPAAGMVAYLFVASDGGNLWPIAIVFWTVALLPAWGLSWAGRALFLYRHRTDGGG